MLPSSIMALAWLTVAPAVSCPTADELAAALARLTPGGDASLGPRSVQLTEDGDALRLTLRDGDGALLAEQRLPRTRASCAELTEAAAVVVTAWRHAADAPVELPDAPAPPGPVPARRVAAPPRLRYEVAAAALLSIASDGSVAGGGEASLALGGAHSSWGGRVGLFATSLRERRLALGSADWTRAALSLGAAYRRGHDWRFELDAGALLALLVVEGNSSGGTAYNCDPGLRAEARVARRFGPLAAFLGVSAVGWLRAERVDTVDGMNHTEIPRFEVLVAAGVDFEK